MSAGEDLFSSSDIAAELLEAVVEAEAEALAAHKSGTCHLSEWSCSFCEVALASGRAS